MKTVDAVPFGDRMVGREFPVLIIAEIGINHEGDVDACARMITAAARAGADAVKLQTSDADEAYHPDSPSYAVFKSAALTRDETAKMFDLARELGIEIFSTAGDMESFDFIENLTPAAHKISSGLMANTPMLRRAAKTDRSILMSTGIGMSDEIRESIECLRSAGNSRLVLLQCTSLYPAPDNTLNLSAIRALEETYGVIGGFSDHSIGIFASALSVGAGASVIEKHFSLETHREGFDHKISVDPKGLESMVREVRMAESMMGDPNRPFSAGQQNNRDWMQRFIVAGRALRKGETLSEENLRIMRLRPGAVGLAPKHFDALVDRQVIRDLPKFAPLRYEDIQ
jgi:sialic acid synthase SpsE